MLKKLGMLCMLACSARPDCIVVTQRQLDSAYRAGNEPTILLGYAQGTTWSNETLTYLSAKPGTPNTGSGSVQICADEVPPLPPADITPDTPVSMPLTVPQHTVPEIDPGSGVSALALLAGVVLCLRGRK